MRTATGAHTGTGLWLVQRATAVLLAGALPALLLLFFIDLPRDFAAWQAWLAPLSVRVLLLLTGGALALHAWVGMRDIFMDYVHSLGMRLALLLAVVTVLAASLVWLAVVLFGALPGGRA